MHVTDVKELGPTMCGQGIPRTSSQKKTLCNSWDILKYIYFLAGLHEAVFHLAATIFPLCTSDSCCSNFGCHTEQVPLARGARSGQASQPSAVGA